MSNVKVKKPMGIGAVPSLDKVFKKAVLNKETDKVQKENAIREAALQKERELMNAQMQAIIEQHEMQKQPYTIITCTDLVNLFAEYNIPVARQTVAAIQKEKIFYIKGQLDVVRK